MANAPLTWQPSQCHGFPRSAARHAAAQPPHRIRTHSGDTADSSMTGAHCGPGGPAAARGHEDCDPAWGAASSRHHFFNPQTAAAYLLRMTGREWAAPAATKMFNLSQDGALWTKRVCLKSLALFCFDLVSLIMTRTSGVSRKKTRGFKVLIQRE